jgi:hypothetical protein
MKLGETGRNWAKLGETGRNWAKLGWGTKHVNKGFQCEMILTKQEKINHRIKLNCFNPSYPKYGVLNTTIYLMGIKIMEY